MKLRNKVAIITGAASGIGLATAHVFAAEGARVVLADINAGRTETASAAVAQAGGETLAVRVDVTDRESVDAMVAANKAVKQYNVDIENYLGCIKTELDESLSRQNDTLSEDQKKAMNLLHAQKNNAAIDELQSIAARLNEQIRIYKAAHPSK